MPTSTKDFGKPRFHTLNRETKQPISRKIYFYQIVHCKKPEDALIRE